MSRTKTLDDTTTASDPGKVSLSRAKLGALRKDLTGIRGWWDRRQTLVSGLIPQTTYIEEHLEHGDSRAAVVVSTFPLLVAAYTDELDCVALLKFPDSFVQRYDLSVGTRLLTVNTYKRGQVRDYDLIAGPLLIPRWCGFEPMIADFLSDDIERIESRKASIGEDEWQRTLTMGTEYREARPGVFRDGRPGFSEIPASPPGNPY